MGRWAERPVSTSDGDLMDNFFNHEYAEQVRQTISKMDDDTAAMFSTLVVHDVLHQHIDDNRRTIDNYTREVLGRVSKRVSKALEGSEEGAVLLEVSKSWEAYVRTPEGADRYNRPIGSRIRPSKYEMKIKGKGPNRKIKVKYQGDVGDNWDSRANEFDLTPALIRAPGKKASAFEEEWNAGINPKNSTERTYNRVTSGSKLLREVGTATGNEKLAVAGAVGEFAGSFGPEAEKVFGPAMRRAAYRYRGTEKKVDPEINAAVRAEIANQMKGQPLSRPKLTPAQVREVNRYANEIFEEQRKKNPDLKFSDVRRKVYQDASKAQPQMRQVLSPEKRMEVSRAIAVDHLNQRLPSTGLASLHSESGKIPPSEGLLIDADGRVVAQAVGYMEDHYLPFNMRNLKALNGGSYVRTRSSGGLTTEDIYTGLMAGARSVTVVSRSGVFTIDFADDFRGTRRYGDVARQMVNRYGKTLDTVQAEVVERTPLSAEERAEIRHQVETEYGHMSDTSQGRKYIESQISAALKEARRSSELTSSELKEINDQALEQAGRADSLNRPMDGGRNEKLPADPAKRFQIIRNELVEAARENKQSRMLRLDGQGYDSAAQALQEQYPYFIANVRNEVYKDPDKKRPKSRETDTGYVRPNYLRPKAVKEGYWDSEIENYEGGIKNAKGEPSGKYSAASTNYQNQKNSRNPSGVKAQEARAAAAAEGKDETKAGAPNLKASPLDDRQRMKMAVEKEKQADVALATVILAAIDTLKPNETRDLRELLGGVSTDDENAKEKILVALRTPSTRKKMAERMTSTVKNLEKVAADKNNEYSEGAAQVLGAMQSEWDDYNRFSSEVERIAQGIEPSEDFVVPAKSPSFFRDVKPGEKKSFYKEKLSQLTTIPLEIETGTDEQLYQTAMTSKELQSIYSKAVEGRTLTYEEKKAAQRAITDDPFLYEDGGPEERAMWAVVHMDDSAESKNVALALAKSKAEFHKRRAYQVERARWIKQQMSQAKEDAASNSDETPQPKALDQ